MKINKPAIESAIRELIRLSIIALVSVFLAWLTSLQQSIDQASVWSMLIFAVLKVADRYKYKLDGTNVLKV